MVFYVIWKKKHLILLKSTYAKERKELGKILDFSIYGPLYLIFG